MSFSVFDAAQEAGDRVAVVGQGHSLTFSELAERVARRLDTLRPLSERDRVGLVGESGLPTLEVLLGLFYWGIPVQLVHPKLTGGEREQLEVEILDVADLNDSTNARTPVPFQVDEGRPLALVSTSGTRGWPRQVVLTRSAFRAAAQGSERNLGWRDDDRWLLGLSVAHVGGLSVVTRCLLARRTVVLPPVGRFEPETFATVVYRERVTLCSLVPTQASQLLDAGWTPPDAVRAILLGGAAAPRSLLERLRREKWPVLTTYGLTEACSQVATQPPGVPLAADPGVGVPLQTVEVKIADGEIFVRGPHVAGVALPDGRITDADGWLATGDLGSLDAEGWLHVAGRKDDRIVTGGENVDPLEVEAALEGVPGLEAICVFGVDDPEWGQLVAAAVVGDYDAIELRSRLASLATFKRPRRIASLPALEIGRTGKVDRVATGRAASARLEPLD